MYKSFEQVDVDRVKRHSSYLRNVNELRRREIRELKANPFKECLNVLEAVISSCTKTGSSTKPAGTKAAAVFNQINTSPCCPSPCQMPPPPCPQKCPCPSTGCSKSGACGGYTPSGWNKAKAVQGRDSNECLAPTYPPCPGRQEEKCPPEGSDALTSGVVDCNMCPSVRVLGEMVFQLERRILEYVFGAEGKNKRRFYGYTVSNVCYMITKESTAPNGKCDTIGKSDKANRFEKIMCGLMKYGYNVKCHPELSQNLINKYGVLACPPDQCTLDMYRLQDPCALSGLISKMCGSPSEVSDLNILLSCLAFLSKCDGKPLFVW